MFLAVFGVLWCFLCLLVYDTSCFEYSFGALEAHTTIFLISNFNSDLGLKGSFVTVGNAVLDVSGEKKIQTVFSKKNKFRNSKLAPNGSFVTSEMPS